jgi:hypothetical protein
MAAFGQSEPSSKGGETGRSEEEWKARMKKWLLVQQVQTCARRAVREARAKVKGCLPAFFAVET